ncbi:putative variant ionotropic glutamate receptor-like 2 [Homarus americanus]|uniref:Putative variant ionotropic glutamate receptor-like 2 n=1 Tax=Homarus americanus TaxID=6706 RepID=A0A8J5TF08_HOMAM|nr:putative variant ionotropic glutamate receptor-like 2 [Homarus americanus]
MFLAVWYLYCLVVSAAYTCNFIAIFTSPAYSQHITTLQQLADSDYRLATRDNGNALVELLSKGEDNVSRRLLEKLDLFLRMEDMIAAMLAGTHAIILTDIYGHIDIGSFQLLVLWESCLELCVLWDSCRDLDVLWDSCRELCVCESCREMCVLWESCRDLSVLWVSCRELSACCGSHAVSCVCCGSCPRRLTYNHVSPYNTRGRRPTTTCPPTTRAVRRPITTCPLTTPAGRRPKTTYPTYNTSSEVAYNHVSPYNTSGKTAYNHMYPYNTSREVAYNHVSPYNTSGKTADSHMYPYNTSGEETYNHVSLLQNQLGGGLQPRVIQHQRGSGLQPRVLYNTIWKTAYSHVFSLQHQREDGIQSRVPSTTPAGRRGGLQLLTLMRESPEHPKIITGNEYVMNIDSEVAYCPRPVVNLQFCEDRDVCFESIVFSKYRKTL